MTSLASLDVQFNRDDPPEVMDMGDAVKVRVGTGGGGGGGETVPPYS